MFMFICLYKGTVSQSCSLLAFLNRKINCQESKMIEMRKYDTWDEKTQDDACTLHSSPEQQLQTCQLESQQ